MQVLRNVSSHREELYSFTSVFEILHTARKFPIAFERSNAISLCQRSHMNYHRVLRRYLNTWADKESPLVFHSVWSMARSWAKLIVPSGMQMYRDLDIYIPTTQFFTMGLDQWIQEAGTQIPQTSVSRGLWDLFWIRYGLVPWDELCMWSKAFWKDETSDASLWSEVVHRLVGSLKSPSRAGAYLKGVWNTGSGLSFPCKGFSSRVLKLLLSWTSM